MKIKSIKIEKLFEIFDYEIIYPENEDVLIITGPNGFGKTKILNIIFHFFDNAYHCTFLRTLIFEKISISLENDFLFEIKKEKDYSLSTYNRKGVKISAREELKFLNSIKPYLIQEQRLLKFAEVEQEKKYVTFNNKEQPTSVVINTIEMYASELKNSIVEASQKVYAISQKLDSTYPRRLIFEKGKISEADYNKRYTKLKNKQEKLIKYGLYETQPIDFEYSEADSKALLVYLNDLEEKLSVFDELLEKLELFTTILNERRFTFKTIEISKNGFVFRTSKGKELNLTQLSSGEQHEVVMLYELIFNTTPNTLVLIDEPEISLHIRWQKEFLKDLLKIVKMQKIQVMIATHSPSIINSRWDLVYTLAKNDA
ncbi:MAG: AAA family ATPase [Chitinophagales bacterium]